MLASVLISCGPKPATPPSYPAARPAQAYAAPTELTARPSNGRINIAWQTNRAENTIISGYNIYLWNENDASDTTNGGFRRINPELYPGDTDADIARESYSLEGVDNGVIYRVYVTMVYPDGMESARSNVAEAIPRPEGSFTLRESFKGNESGFSLRKIKSVPTDDLDNDIYLANIDGKLWVASPQRINVVLRQSRFYRLSEYSSLDATSPTSLSGKPDNALPISNHLMFMLQDQDKSYALLRIDSVDPKEKIAKISFIYQPRPETLVFH
ncbi:MAG: hypothetical protein E4G91_03930 [Candidatus Zixiibacteriota bacterium]|nr:MAG: hypothetical protein E4G91_03930 [candidate division Zixibacteria bacterium]